MRGKTNEENFNSVDVLGDSIMAAQDKNGFVWVGVRWVCDALGMTEGQMKRQVKNIKKDMLFSKGGSNQIPLPTGSGAQEVFCIRNDFIPLWLAKITITEKTRRDRPEFAEKLLQYQLKAKDILAEAFMPKQNAMPQTIDGKIMLLAQGHVELKEEIDSVKADLEVMKMDLPILPVEADRITQAARRKGVSVLGGKMSKAYRNRSMRQKVYNGLYWNLKYNFSVTSYKAIKRSQCDKAIEIINKWEPPLFLSDEIRELNN